MSDTPRPAFAALRRKYAPTTDDYVPLVALVAVDDSDLQPAHAPRQVIQYLRNLGLPADSLSDLYNSIAGLDDEEELAAHWCREGLAVSHASEDTWFLFMDDNP